MYARDNFVGLETYRLLLDHKADVNAQDYSGTTALMETDDADVTALLLQHGAKVSLKDKLGKTALDWARDNRDQARIRLLEAALKKEKAKHGTGQHRS
jgi:ankyrin repeat protein